MGTIVGLGGGEAGASPRKGEDDNDDLHDGAPPELALPLVMTAALAGVLHIGKWRRHLDGG